MRILGRCLMESKKQQNSVMLAERLYGVNRILSIHIVMNKSLSVKQIAELNKELGEIIKALREAEREQN